MSFEKEVFNIIDCGREVDPVKWTVADAIAKLAEEAGEFSQAIQTKVGKLKKNLPPNSDFEEGADVVMCAIDVLSQANLDKTPEEIIEGLTKAIAKKIPKWREKVYEAGFNKAS